MTHYPELPGAQASGASLVAAVSMSATAANLRARVAEHLRKRPSTVHETAAALGCTVPSVQPRFSELVALGEIADTNARRTNVSGRKAAVWALSDSLL